MSAAPKKNVETVLRQFQTTIDEVDTSPFGDSVLRVAYCVLDFLSVSGIQDRLRQDMGLSRQWQVMPNADLKTALAIAETLSKFIEVRLVESVREGLADGLAWAAGRGGIDPWPWERSERDAEPSRAEE